MTGPLRGAGSGFIPTRSNAMQELILATIVVAQIIPLILIRRLHNDTD